LGSSGFVIKELGGVVASNDANKKKESFSNPPLTKRIKPTTKFID